MNLIHDMDLNALRALRALLETRSVTRAAAATGVTQSAMSHALRKLRTLLGDRLLVMDVDGTTLTPKALALAERLPYALDELMQLVSDPGEFAPGTSQRVFTIGATDYFDVVVLPALYARIEQATPGVSLRVLRPPDGDLARGLGSGLFDVAVGVDAGAAEGLKAVKLFEDDFLSCVRRDHPLATADVDFDAFATASHVMIAIDGRGAGAVDRALAALGRERTRRVSIASFLTAPYLVTQSDLVLTGPRKMIERLQRVFELQVFATPVRVPKFTVRMYWHPRLERDPAQKWLRSELRAAAR